VVNPPPAPQLYTFGFLSQLVDIHFPGSTGPASPAFNVSVTITVLNAAFFPYPAFPIIGTLISGKSQSLSSFTIPGLQNGITSMTMSLANITAQPTLTLWTAFPDNSAFGNALSIEGPTQTLNVWGTYVAKQISNKSKTDTGIADPASGTSTETPGPINFMNGGNLPKGSCWFKGGFVEVVGAPPDPSYYLACPFTIPVNFNQPNIGAVGCGLPGWQKPLP
jgi:hypothetical protein